VQKHVILFRVVMTRPHPNLFYLDQILKDNVYKN